MLPPVLSLPQFRLLFSGQAVSVIGDALFPVALAFAVLDGSPGELGLVLAAETIPLAVLILAAGVWADRLNRRNVMIVWDTSLQREIPEHALSRVISLDWFTTTGLMPIGFAVVAPAAELLGTHTTMTACALIVIALFLAAPAVGDVRRLTAP